jgi:uncharacterized membrane protein
MKLNEYKKIMMVIVFAVGVLIAYSVTQNSTFIAVVAVTFGIVFLHVLRRGLSEVEHDERTVIIRNKAASATLAIITVSMFVTGLLLVFLSGQWIGDYEQTGYLLAYQASFILILNALLNYYYRKKLGG